MKTYNYTKPTFLMLSFLLLTAFSFAAQAKQEQLLQSLPLECSKIPNKSDHLCFIQTQSPYGPYDDIVFYRISHSGDVVLLGSQSGGVATFGGFDFSTGGIYMWVSWAEEGHPRFAFYRTTEFMANGINTKALEILGDYYFNGFEKFTDSGEVVYSLDDAAFENCDNAGESVSYKIDPETSEKYCVKQFSLITQ